MMNINEGLLKRDWVSFICFALSFFLLQACSTSGITISSVPNAADVYSVKQNGERGILLGKTPLKIPTGDYGAIEIVKDGHSASYALLPEPTLPKRQVYFVALTPISKEWLSKAVVSGNNEILSESVSELLDFQKYIQENKTQEAESFQKVNAEKYKSVSVFHLLSGHFNYQKKNFAKSKEHFSIAASLDPKNEEAREMLKILQNLKN